MKPHANSHQNQEVHHLYEIYDTTEEDVYKYGICGEPLYPDGSSPRANRQVREFNRLVGFLRFLARVLMTGIPGRKRAEEIEEETKAGYESTHGRRPRGNPSKTSA
jgi:URI fold toxin 2 of polymorphic toxin system component